MQPEKRLENDILRFLWSKDIYCWKVKSVGTFDPKKRVFRKPSPFYKKGVSDILGILPTGTLFAIEVKVKGSYPTPEQKMFLNEITQRKGLAGVCRSIEDVEILLGGNLNDARRVATSDTEPSE